MRLIDADALKEKFTNYETNGIHVSMDRYALRKIDDAPTVDAVPVIRCKDCKWGREACGNIECHVDLNIPSEYHGYDWYCPNGEREEE